MSAGSSAFGAGRPAGPARPAAHRPAGLTTEQTAALDQLQDLAAQVAQVRRETVADQADKIVGGVRALVRD